MTTDFLDEPDDLDELEWTCGCGQLNDGMVDFCVKCGQYKLLCDIDDGPEDIGGDINDENPSHG